MATKTVVIEDHGATKAGKRAFRVSYTGALGEPRVVDYKDDLQWHTAYWRRKGWQVVLKAAKRQSQTTTPKRKARR